ncbi:MAG: hypothetical protein WCD79_12835 [Chthoniobacteraceae bacterium]
MKEAKVRLQKTIIRKLRKHGSHMIDFVWLAISRDKRLKEELESYDLISPQRVSALNKVAFPELNHSDVDAALNAGNNLNDLYQIALGRAIVAKDSAGKNKSNRRGGLLVVNHSK